MTLKSFKSHLDSLRIAAGVSFVLSLVGVVFLAIFYYYTLFYIWLIRNYSDTFANASMLIFIFVIVTLVTYIKIRIEENK